MKKMTYEGVGVSYDVLDAFKRAAQAAARETSDALRRFNLSEVEMSRGESAYLIRAPHCYFAHVEEGLGTKNLVADAMRELTGESYYDRIAQDTVAMIVNDMITLGALPLSVAMHLAVGDSGWFKDEKRSFKLIEGWKRSCILARCSWGGGETPTLKGIVIPGTVLLSGSAIGIIDPKKRIIDPGNIRHGDVIVLVESSGIHSNGLTMARKIAGRKGGFFRKIANLLFPRKFPLRALPKGYLTMIDGETYGETLLTPTHIYVPLIEDCLEGGVDIHYAVNITGHGWRKLMRADRPLAYVIDRLPSQLPIFDFLQEHGPVDDREAYGNFNMGAGFALYVPETDALKVKRVAERLGFRAFNAGYIEENKEKRVYIGPKNLEYSEGTLGVR